jgi:hypothetical protein
VPTLVIELRSFSFFRVHMELRSGKVLLQLSPEAMATATAPLTTDENTPVYTPIKQSSSSNWAPTRLYARLQVATNGYLWLVVASLVLILAAGILLFPQKTWNRMMMQLFGCVTLNIRGKQYRFCEQPPAAQEQGGIPV